jgi:hypothetical protein
LTGCRSPGPDGEPAGTHTSISFAIQTDSRGHARWHSEWFDEDASDAEAIALAHEVFEKLCEFGLASRAPVLK